MARGRGRRVGRVGAVAGPIVATDSIAPATRHTARKLAISGMTVPVPPNGAVSFCAPGAAPPGALLAAVGEHVAVELPGVVRDHDVEGRLVPPWPAGGFTRHLRRESDPSYQVSARETAAGAGPSPMPQVDWFGSDECSSGGAGYGAAR